MRKDLKAVSKIKGHFLFSLNLKEPLLLVCLHLFNKFNLIIISNFPLDFDLRVKIFEFYS